MTATIATPGLAAQPPVAVAVPARARRSGRAAAGGSEALAWVERRLGLTSSGLGVIGFPIAGWIVGRQIRSSAMLLLVYGSLVVVSICYAMGRRKLAVLAERSDLPTRVRVGQLVDVELALQAKR